MLVQIAKNAKKASLELLNIDTRLKNEILKECANELITNCQDLLSANALDIKQNENLKAAFVDRLRLNTARVEAMADALRKVAALDEVIGETISGRRLENSLKLQQIRVPLGVVGIIYESRPNVSADAFALCFKSQNALILRGGKEAIHTNTRIVECFRRVLKRRGIDENCVQIISDTRRELVREFIGLDEYIDVIIPRGSASLINEVKQHSKIPCIQTGVGNCHIFIDESAKLTDALNIADNAKRQRPGVCNSVETLLVHESIAAKFLPALKQRLSDVELRACQKSQKYLEHALLASEEDYAKEFEDLILAVKIVSSIDEAIAHIRRYSTQHSEAIISQNHANIERFFNEIDSAVLYANASTRFSDGGEFGFGAEIGISTQKLHARGPMGLRALTSTKYLITGSGHIR